MKKFLCSVPVTLLLVLCSGPMASCAPALKVTEGRIKVDPNTTSIKVSGAGELDALAKRAFNTHGAFSVVASGASYEVRFTSAGAAQVKVEVLKGTTPVFSQVAQGSSVSNALYRAGDLAVKNITGEPGYFASKLAFVSQHTGKSEIYVGDLFLVDIRQITKDGAHVFTPRWSPDGSKILYTSYFKSGFPDIFKIDLATMQRTTFVSVKGTNSGARFSPNGSQVAMILSGPGNPELYVSDARGTLNAASRRTKTDAVEASPCWSPDGSKILYTSDAGGKANLYIMPANGGSAQRVSPGFAYSTEPDWSRAKPNLIAFTAGVGKGFQIGVYDLNGNNTKPIKTNSGGDAIEPSWLPDGRHLVFTRRSANKRTLCILDTVNGKTTVLSTAYAEKASVWAP